MKKNKILLKLFVVLIVMSNIACGQVDDSTLPENNKITEEFSINDGKKRPENKETKTVSSNLTLIKKYSKLKPSKGFEYESNGDGTCTLTGIGICSDEDIIIPERSPDGDKLTKIGEYAFYNCDNIKSIVFIDRTIELDKNAFQSCEFEQLVISDSDLKIGKSAFSYCDDVNTVLINNSVLEIEEYAFYDCGKDLNLEIIATIATIDDNAFQSSAVEDIKIDNCEIEIGDNGFSYCKDITNVGISSSVVEVGEYAFYGCGDDMEISFQNSEITLNENAFQSSEVVNLEIDNCETSIDDNGFSYCDKLIGVIIGEGNIEIGEYAFYDCSKLNSLSIASDSKSLENKIYIDDSAFQSCERLASVHIGSGEIEIRDNAFSYCDELESITIGEGSLDVGKYVFYGCPNNLEIYYNNKHYNKESIEDIRKTTRSTDAQNVSRPYEKMTLKEWTKSDECIEFLEIMNEGMAEQGVSVYFEADGDLITLVYQYNKQITVADNAEEAMTQLFESNADLFEQVRDELILETGNKNTVLRILYLNADKSEVFSMDF